MSPTVIGEAITTLQAIPNPATASVTLIVGLSATVTRILRNDANGIAEVRAQATQLPSAGTGQLIIEDYEAAAGNISYTVTADGATVTASTVLELSTPWLIVPALPGYSEPVETITAYSSTRTAQTTVHEVIGRRDPLTTLGVLGSRRGAFDAHCRTLAQARTLEAVLERGLTVMLKQNVPGMDMYFAPVSSAVSPVAPAGEDTRYALSIAYTQTARPAGYIAAALGWTFDELTAGYATFDDVAAAFFTFDDLTLRREN